MTRKTRSWMGVTLLAVIAFNYLVIGIPLFKRINYLETKIKVMNKAEDSYIVDVLKREVVTLDKKLVILNCAAFSIAIIIASWIAYGLIVYREERRSP